MKASSKLVALFAIAPLFLTVAACSSGPSEEERLSSYTEVNQAATQGKELLAYKVLVDNGAPEYEASLIALDSLLANAETVSDTTFVDTAKTSLATELQEREGFAKDLTSYFVKQAGGEVGAGEYAGKCATEINGLEAKLMGTNSPTAAVTEVSNCLISGMAADSARCITSSNTFSSDAEFATDCDDATKVGPAEEANDEPLSENRFK